MSSESQSEICSWRALCTEFDGTFLSGEGPEHADEAVGESVEVNVEFAFCWV